MRALLAAGAAAMVLGPAPPAAAQDGTFAVAVFEGRGLGHGLGMPLDGANAVAHEDGASAETVLDRFYPGTGRSTRAGIVRVLVAARDDPEAGIDVTLPEGATIRDGRTTPVAPSFPIRVPSANRARLSFEGGRYRAEVLDTRSISGTVEVTPPAGSGSPPSSSAPTSPGSEDAAPGLGASEQSLWLLPRGGGSIVVAPEPGGESQAFPGPVEIVAEAERLHVVAELDVETYLSRLNFSLPDGTPLAPAALDAAVIAARSYALRASLSQPRVGGFHLFASERSLPYSGTGETSAAVRAAVKRTRGQIVTTAGGVPAAALVCISAGGETAGAGEVFGVPEEALPYLAGTKYPGGQEFAWRVDLALDDVAAKLGYTGDAEAVEVVSRGPSGRPTTLRVRGDAGELNVQAAEFHRALRLPSSMFGVRIETRPEPLAAREPSPAFQELPGDPITGAAAPEPAGKGSSRIPLILALVAGATLALSFAVLLVADVQRRMRAFRARREARLRHPTGSAEPSALLSAAPLENQPEPEPEPEQEGSEPETSRTPIEGPTWHNEPEWLSDLFPDEPDEPRNPRP